jgi:hypothetical protein
MRTTPDQRSDSGRSRRSTVPAFRRGQQHRAAIGTDVRLIERRDKVFVEEVWKQDSVWYRVVAQAKASGVGKSSLGNGFVPRGGFVYSVALTNYPG